MLIVTSVIKYNCYIKNCLFDCYLVLMLLVLTIRPELFSNDYNFHALKVMNFVNVILIRCKVILTGQL